MRKNSGVDVIIVGGGLAGLVNAIHLSKCGIKVLLFEKNAYPKHKVCGEYVSNEVLPYLKSLDIDPFNLGAIEINRFELSTPRNKIIRAKLPLGGFGISRFTLDHALAKKAKQQNVIIQRDSVVNIQFLNDGFIITTKSNQDYVAKIVIGAYGKRTSIDVKLDRNFIKKKSPFLAIKTHAKGDFPEDLVGLHNFDGGYCGVSKVEKGYINICYIADFKSFKQHKNIDDFQRKIIYKNDYLKAIFENSKPVFTTPLSISQISFSTKKPIERHIIMCGDTAGMIHPLCGNGMSMAIRSAQIASHLIVSYFNNEIKSRRALENAYLRKWNKEFKTRLKTGHIVSSLFKMNYFSEFILIGLKVFPSLLPKIIKQTHGKPMVV